MGKRIMGGNNFMIGLTDAQVAESRRKYGANILTPPQREPWWKGYLRKFSDSLIVILMVAGVLSVGISFYEYFALGQDWKVFFEPIGIFMAILLATTLAFIFESKANKAFRLLNQVNDDELVEVLRNGTTTTIPRRDVVVGDIVNLNTGDEIAADGDLLQSVTLSVDESSLTGEPICHKTIVEEEFDKDATYPSDHVLKGTKVMEGHGVMRVTKIGDATEMGKVFVDAQIDNSVKTPLNEQLDHLSKWITYGSYAFAALVILAQTIKFLGWESWQSYLPIIPVALIFYLVVKVFKRWSKKQCAFAIAMFFILYFGSVVAAYAMTQTGSTGNEWSELAANTLQTLMIAVTLIVVAVPEGLPMAVTLSLAYSMRRMFKTNNLVRKMHACETMGATTVICTDKTGTLTQNRMQVADDKFFGDIDSDIIAEGIAVNSTATLDFSEAKPKPIGNPTEGALLLWLHDRDRDYREIKASVEVIAELPFSTERKFMATAVNSKVTDKPTLYLKGAPEILLRLCNKIAGDVDKAQIEQLLLGFQNKAMRTLGFAFATMPDEKKAKETIEALGKLSLPEGVELVFEGVVAISDPVRDDVPAAVAQCRDAGIDIKIVTGDTPATAREIGRQIGLWMPTDSDRNIITGPEFAALSDEQLLDRVMDLKIIARARPSDKRRLVKALQDKGQVVAVTGDGTNDAPALHQAHVGLSMGDGTSVAKEASDITIIDNSFASIGRAVMWGRSLYKNIQRFLLFQLTVNVAACLLVLIGSFIGAESPLSVTQMLWVNLIMDTFGAMALASLPPSDRVMREKPRRRTASILTRVMGKEIVAVGVLFFIITIGLYWLFNHADVTSIPQMFHATIGEAEAMTPYEATLLFSVFVWTHFWYMFDARTFGSGQSIFRCSFSGGFWTIVAIIVIGQLVITELLYEFFNVEPMLHTADWKFNPSGALDLAIIIVGSSLVVWVREIWHGILRKKRS